MPMRYWLLFLVVVSCCLFASAQRTTRKSLKTKATTEKVMQKGHAAPRDTIFNADDSLAIKISGYEKMLRSRRESLFISNNSEIPVNGIALEITYLDMSDRQLHSREVARDCDIPPSETRMIDFPAWDKQQVWYYYLSEPPRTRFQATPFKVKIRVKYILVLPSKDGVKLSEKR